MYYMFCRSSPPRWWSPSSQQQDRLLSNPSRRANSFMCANNLACLTYGAVNGVPNSGAACIGIVFDTLATQRGRAGGWSCWRSLHNRDNLLVVVVLLLLSAVAVSRSNERWGDWQPISGCARKHFLLLLNVGVKLHTPTKQNENIHRAFIDNDQGWWYVFNFAAREFIPKAYYVQISLLISIYRSISFAGWLTRSISVSRPDPPRAAAPLFRTTV